MTSHPNDQADGFFEPQDDWARRQALGAYDDTWQFLFDFQALADKRDWDKARQRLADFKGDVPFHDFSLKAFRKAAEGGQLDIVQSMFARNFRLPEDDGEDAVQYLAMNHLAKAEPVLRYLLDNNYATGDGAVYAIARSGTPAMMDLLRRHGCDIQGEGLSFSVALHSGNTGMMQYLHQQGAELCRAPIVAGLQGGIEAYQQHNRDGLVSTDTAQIRNVYAALLEKETRDWQYYYCITAANHMSLDDFRAVPQGTANLDMNFIQMAARAGYFGEVMEAAIRETKHPLTADDLLRPDKTGATALSILAARGEVDKVFDARLWVRNPDEAAKLQAALKPLNLVADKEAFTADVQRQRLKALARAANLRLKPPGPK